MTKAEGDRESDRTNERADERSSERNNERSNAGGNERDQPHAVGRDRLDPREVREVLDETSEKHRHGEDIGASGISNRTLAEEQEEQAELPARGARKAGGGA
jgi:hypothetical protein